jgi:hypothetical protein
LIALVSSRSPLAGRLPANGLRHNNNAIKNIATYAVLIGLEANLSRKNHQIANRRSSRSSVATLSTSNAEKVFRTGVPDAKDVDESRG